MFTKLLDGQRRLDAVDHRVAVGTNGNQVRFRVDFVFFTNLPYGVEVVNMSESIAEVAIDDGKIEPADGADTSVMSDASSPRFRVTFVCINCDDGSCSF